MPVPLVLLLSLTLVVTPPSCRPATTATAQAIIKRAIDALGLPSVGTGVCTSTVTDGRQQEREV